MTSLRNIAAERSPRDGYLDAARDCILDVGWRRTTLTEVARRAGVSRMTIYRSWHDMPTLLGDLMTREWSQVVTGRRADEDPHEDLVEAVVSAVRELRDNELFMRIVELDPELLLPYLLARRGRSQDAVLELVAARIADGQGAGRMRPGDPVLLARGLLLACHGFVISAQTMVDDEITLADLDDELRHLLRAALAP